MALEKAKEWRARQFKKFKATSGSLFLFRADLAQRNKHRQLAVGNNGVAFDYCLFGIYFSYCRLHIRYLTLVNLPQSVKLLPKLES